MVNYSDLPKYTNLHILTNNEKEIWNRQIDALKKHFINPIIQYGTPEFKSSYDYDFNKIKQWINDDLLYLVKFFLLSIKELRFKKVKEARMLVSLLIGQQEYIEDDSLKEFIDGVDYGHLKKLEEINMKYKETQNGFYLKMMETLCSPYIDVMQNVVYMCENLFKGESMEFDIFGDLGKEDYLKG